MKLYGIPNCTTVKKARAWLDENSQPYDFHDFKKQGVTRELLQAWIAQAGWEPLINQQGTTWRKLDAATQTGIIDAEAAIDLMLAAPSVIKRPVLDKDGRIFIGFKPNLYETLLR
ncbi:MAG: arsenate reductase [Proteobacteria bacterium]|nr:arsenate reductase [Pseudomonadota bacterium]